MAKQRKKRPKDMLRMQWSPEYQRQQLDQELAQLIEQEGWWQQHVNNLRDQLRVARRQLREAQRAQERIRAINAVGWPLFEQPVE